MTDQERFEDETQRAKYLCDNYPSRFAFRGPQTFADMLEGADAVLHKQQAEVTRALAVSAAKEEQLLVEVLQEHLGRLIVTDDFKDCEMKYYEVLPDEYVFAYKGIDLGVVKKEMKMDYDLGDFTKNLCSIQQIITFRKIKQP